MSKRSHLSILAAVQTLQSEARYLFGLEDVAKLTGHNATAQALKTALYRLTSAGHIVSVSKQPSAWLIIPPEHRHYGAPPVLWWVDAFMKHTEPHYYLGLLSAARHWGSSHYAIQKEQLMVSHPRRPVSAGRVVLEFSVKAGLQETPTVLAAGSVSVFRVSSRESTLLDLLRHQDSVGGLEAIIRIARDFRGDISADGLLAALNALDQVPVAQRLGFILDAIGCRHSGLVANWLSQRGSRKTRLIPSSTVGFEDISVFHPVWKVGVTQYDVVLIKELL